MGVEARIVLYARDPQHGEAAANAAYARLAALDRVLSDYRADSDLNRLCAAPARTPVATHPDLFNVIRTAQQVSAASGGAFDITIGPLVALWREARQSGELPTDSHVAEARRRVGYQHIDLGEATHTVTLALPGMQLDLGGIAKGYAAEHAIRAMREQGIRSALVALAGDIAVSDAPPGKQGWQITVDHTSDASDFTGDEFASNSPSLEGEGGGVGGAIASNQTRTTGTHRKTQILTISNAAISTSGSNQQFITVGGTRYSHIIDPRAHDVALGITSPTIVTVTSYDSNGALADAISSAACILGPQEGAALVARFPNCSAIFGDG